MPKEVNDTASDLASTSASPVERTRPARAFYAGAAAFVLSLVPVLLATGLLWSQEQEARRDEARMLSEQAALRLGEFVRARLLALEIVRLEAGHSAFVADERFDSLAEATGREYSGFQAINWMDADGVIRRVVPREPNLPALGRSISSHPGASGPAAAALRSREPGATAPIDLMQGGRGIATYFPVVRDGELVGAVNGVFRLEDLVHTCLGERMLDRFAVVIDDEGEHVFGDPSALSQAALDSGQVGVHRLDVLNRQWRLQLARPASAVDANPALLLFFLVGLAFSIALAGAAYSAARRQTARLEAEREQRLLEKRLGRAERLEGLGRLSGGIAHDFNNLLAVILAAGEHALTHGSDKLPPTVRESLEDSQTAAERAAGLTRQLLAFSREQPRAARTLDLVEALRGTERMLRRLIREDVELSFSLPAEPVWIVSDLAQLTQIVVNLAINAADALSGPGRIEVALEVREAADHEPAGSWAVLRVSDDGPGIDERHIDRVFEPFFTTKGELEGTGLGLATVYGLLQQHEGHVTVESKLGHGATFRAFFPLTDAPERTGAIRKKETPTTPDGGRALALLVEDEALLRKAASRALQIAGFEVVAAEDGAKALALFEDAQFRPQVIVSDVVMPTMGGLELLRELRQRGVASPAVLSSGYSNVDLSPEELASLRAVFLAKPYAARQLADATRGVLARWPATLDGRDEKVV